MVSVGVATNATTAAANTTTPPCNATYQGDSWDGVPVWAKEQQPQSQTGKEREYLALLRDTGVWRLTEIRASEAAPGRAAGLRREALGGAVGERQGAPILVGRVLCATSGTVQLSFP